jgi:small subunit ribosomal protein S1
VDLNGIDGLIHISELSWSHVNHPSEVVAIGDDVQVKVLDIDRDRQRISLGLKQTQEDPWQRVVSMYNVGDELEGKVTKVVTFGAFVEILDGVEGLVHISELAPYHVENPREIVEPGVDIMVKILEIDSERRRLSLSAKRVENQILPRREGAPPPDDAPEGAGDLDDVRDLGLSEDVFAHQAIEAPGAVDVEDIPASEPEAAADDATAEAVLASDADEPAAEAPVAEEPAAAAEEEPAAVAEEEPAAVAEDEPAADADEPAVDDERPSADELDVADATAAEAAGTAAEQGTDETA